MTYPVRLPLTESLASNILSTSRSTKKAGLGDKMALKSGYPSPCFRVVIFALVTVFLLSLTSFADDPDNDADRDHPIEREQWFLHGRTYQGKVAPQLLEKAQQQRDTLRHQAILRSQVRTAITSSSGTPTPVWTELGPSPMKSVATPGDDQDYGLVTGRATTVAVDQNDATGNTVYLGGASGGVWKSTNAANSDNTKVSWKSIIDDQASTAVGAIAIQPGNGNIVLVGTGEPNSSTDSYYGLGILRSTDAGNSWTFVTSANNGLRPFHGLAFSKIAFSSDNPNIVVAAAAAASEGITVGAENPANNAAACANASISATCRGLYYSLNGGVSWTQATMSDGPGLTPDNGSASSVVYSPQQHKFYAAARAHGFYVSSDGITFTRMGADSFGFTQPNASSLSTTNCPNSPTNLATCPLYRGEIAIVPGRDEMYVWYVDSSTTPVNGGIYQTNDGGKTWIALNVNGITSCGDSAGCGTDQGTYNLALAAIPNGATATDLYAGAINIFRCQINSTNSTCTSSPFINLTHVYGCVPTGSFSKVHPDQHWFDFLQSNANIMYFANDGGIYRTLAALSANGVPASCPANPPATPFYPFENLNGTMGSMTQFVWFSLHPSDQYIMLGGTQDNGSPAIDSANSGLNGLTWRSVQGGDGGYNDINPNNGNEWFASFTRVNVYHCANGTNCTDAQFTSVVNSGKVGGDSAAFYMPYMLDPQNSNQLVIGTCRVWRTTTAGTNGIALSQKFDGTSGSTACAQAATSFVNALAAGGPSTASGSQVIYAGTDDGHVFATTSAVNSTTTWNQVSSNSGFANSSNYPISGIAIDPRVAAGTTAYVTVMGFRTSHVFQTTNAGTTWSDITGNIPDSPADGVVVDKNSGTIYVGTDVGVFSTDTPNGSSTVWTEVGPATGVGTLPNVAVTRLAIFAPAGQPERLRVSTYGRGIWEMSLAAGGSPDYTLAISNPTLLTYPGQAVTFNGTLAALGGYNSTLTLSCDAPTGGAPGTCSPNPAAPNPSATTSFTVSAANSTVADFSFRIKGVGTDANALVRQAPVSLRVIDFSLSAPSPASIANLPAGSSTTVLITATSLGSFDQQVSFSCSGLPAGITCSAAPISFTPGGSVQASVTVSASPSTAPGTYSGALAGTSNFAGGISRVVSQPLSVTVTSPLFRLSTTGFSSTTVNIPQPLTATITVNPSNGYTGTIALSCTGSSGVPSSACSFNPPSITVSAAPVTSALTVATTAGVGGGGQVTVKATDGTNTNIAVLPFTLVAPDYSMSFGTANSATVKAGAGATGALALTAVGSFNTAVNFTVAGCPSLATCTMSPNPASPSSTSPVNATLTITTTAPTVGSLRGLGGQHTYFAMWIGLSFGAVGFVFLRRSRGSAALLIIACTMLLGMAACGGGGGSGGGTTPVPKPGTPAGTYTLVVTGTAGTTVKTANFTLTVQ